MNYLLGNLEFKGKQYERSIGLVMKYLHLKEHSGRTDT